MDVIAKLKGINLNEIQDKILKSKIQKAIETFDDVNDLSDHENKVLRKIFNQAEKEIAKNKQPPIKVPAKPAPKYKRYEILTKKDIDQLTEEDWRTIRKERERIRLVAKSHIEKRVKKST